MKRRDFLRERACGCIDGLRVVCVRHCGGHRVPDARPVDIDRIRAEGAREALEKAASDVEKMNIVDLPWTEWPKGALTSFATWLRSRPTKEIDR